MPSDNTSILDPTAARVRALGESPTMAIDGKAKALRAAGEDVIGFGAGEPDFPTPPHVVAAAQAACADPAMHKYTPAAGLPALRAAIARVTLRDSNVAAAPEQVVVCNGGKYALFSVFQTLIEPGDEVLLPAPYWVSYPEQIRLAGGTVVAVQTGAESEFKVTVEQLEAARTRWTKALVFVSPSNPTGAVYTADETRAIGSWAADAGIWVITDEIYQHLVYGDASFTSMPGVVPELQERAVIVNGVAKTFAMTGWRVGWAVAPPAVAAAMARLSSQTTSNISNVSQAAALAALEGPRDVVEQMRATYDRRRLLAHERLAAIPGVVCPLPRGAFYVFPSVKGVLGRRVGGRAVHTSEELCNALLDVAKVALVPGEGFGAPGYVRLSYALDDTDLERGLERIVEAVA